jgi:hypothetical protein
MKLRSISKGEIAQLRCQLEAAKKGFISSIPTIEVGYDLLIDDGKDIIRAQIKYCNRKHSVGSLELSLVSKASERKYYSKKDIDIILVYLPIKDTILMFKPEKFHKRGQIQINLENKNSKHFYENFIW